MHIRVTESFRHHTQAGITEADEVSHGHGEMARLLGPCSDSLRIGAGGGGGT